MQPTALPPPSPSWTDFFQGLPPQLQLVLVVVAGAVVGVLLFQKFFKNFRGDAPKSTDYAVGDPTTFADMSSVKKLAQLVGQEGGLIDQISDCAVAVKASAASTGRVADLVAQLLVDMREEREKEEKEAEFRRGFEQGKLEAVRKAPPRGGST